MADIPCYNTEELCLEWEKKRQATELCGQQRSCIEVSRYLTLKFTFIFTL